MTNTQLQQLQQAINDRYGFIAAQMQSVDYVPDPQQLERWKQLGLVGQDVTPATFASSIPAEMHLLRNAFIMGRVADAFDHGATFEEIMAYALNMPLLKPDIAAIAVAEQQTANYIRNFAGDVATEAGKIWAQKQAETVRSMAIEYHSRTLEAKILDEAEKVAAGIPVSPKRVTTWQQFASELHHTMDDKARDWQRVAYTELVDAQKQGEAHRQLSQQGPDELVYKLPMPTACPQCRHLYLLPDGKTPRLFRLKDMLDNGTNIGCKAHPTKGGKVVPGGRPDGMETLKAVVGVVHPYCQCQGIFRATGYEPWLTDKQKAIIVQHKTIRKSQMAFDFHHAAYDRVDPRTGKLEHIEAHGQQHHVVAPPSPVIEQPQEATVNAIKTKKELVAALQEADGQTLYSAINATGSSRERFYIKRQGFTQTVHRSAVDAARDELKLVQDYPSGSQWKLKKNHKQVVEPSVDTNLREQLEAHKATLAAQYVEQANAIFERLKANFGADLRGKGPDGYTISNGGWVKTWDKYRGMTQRDADNEVHLLDYAVKDAAERYAEATVEAWHGKIISKVKDLQNSTVHRLNGYMFIITGDRDGKRISIEQNMIINRSTNGLLFNQFPARIYVDGKFHSEAAYKKVTGDDAVERAAKEQLDAEKRAKYMLPSGLFAKYDKVKLKLVRKDGTRYETEGTVTTERSGKTVVRAGANRFNMRDYAIETEKLARWNGKGSV